MSSLEANLAATGDAHAVAAAPRRQGEFHIPSLDGLRAISFLVVFISHAGLSVVPGGFGVTVFFFLSGFLITTLMRIEFLASSAVSLSDFYLRRVLRILPPFYLVLAAATLGCWVGIVPGSIELKPMLALLLHYANYWEIFEGTVGQPSGTGVYWSLAVEEHFYLVFPFVFLVLQKRLPERFRAQAAVLLVGCALVLAWRSYLVVVEHVPEARTFFATDTRLDSILFGCALALGANPVIDPPKIPRGLLLHVLVPAGAALLLFCLVYRGHEFRESVRYTLQGIALAPLFVGAMRAPDWGPFRLLNVPLLRRAGALSYSLYLVHQVVLFTLEQWLGTMPIVRGLVALVLSTLLAELIHRAVEKPCARLRRKLAHTTWLSDWTARAR